ncbi:MAG: Na/Pi cotransporter family protein [Planctomycetes bacterium]|nr:Na/Pi cotransporter family protein [Planctomycetota bacterium]
MGDTTQVLDWFELGVGLFGGLALFLYGMESMTGALQAVAGDGMRAVLARLSKNRFAGALTGAIVTAVIQSSSVTTVLVVGFVSAGLMSLQQTVGIIMGANVGTTITAQIIAFRVTDYALIMVALGFFTNFTAKKEVVTRFGAMLMGLGLVFYGMGLMSTATTPLRSYEPFVDAMATMDRPLYGIGAAALFTALVQSSSATTGIVIVLATQGFISLEAGIALALGANVGTCGTALLASVGKPRVARQAAMVHVIFNVLGALLWVGFIPDLAQVVRELSPSFDGLPAAERLAAETPRQIANAHTLFNLSNLLLFIPFTGLVAKLVLKLVPDRPAPEIPRTKPEFLDAIYLKTPELAVDRVRLELGRMGCMVTEAVRRADLRRSGEQERDALRSSCRSIQELHDAIIGYIRQLSQGDHSEKVGRRLERLLEASNHYYSIADTILLRLIPMDQEWMARGLKASQETVVMFREFHVAVVEMLRDATIAVEQQDEQLAAELVSRKHDVYERIAKLQARLADRLASPDPDRIVVYRLESALVEELRHIFYFGRRIAKSVVSQVQEAPDPGAVTV